ncbi:MAG: preprotein translocase subunit YajC [Acidimicrobiales bacterium]|jgi:preprotein translocase subunit YajC
MSPVHVSAISAFHSLATLSGPLLFAATKKSGSSATTLIFFVLLFGVGYMFLIRPQRRRRQAAVQTNKQISVGDKVMLSSGIYGRVDGFVGDHARIEIAPGTVIEVMRQAVSQRVEDPVAADADMGTSSYSDHGHDDLVEDAGHDPYSVGPLESGENTEPDEDPDDHDDKSGGGSH